MWNRETEIVEVVVENLPEKKAPHADGFTGKLYQKLKNTKSTVQKNEEQTSKLSLLHWYQKKTKTVQEKYKTISFPKYKCKIPNKVLEIISKLRNNKKNTRKIKGTFKKAL